jgi:Carbamoyl-phosphate synthase L chain, ATP binding domain
VTALLLNKKHPIDEIGPWARGSEQDIAMVCGPKVELTDDARAAGWQHLELREDYARSDWLVPLCRKLSVDKIIAIAESDIIRAAAARELLGLPGQPVASALAYRDKYMMKSIAATAGIPTAPMTLVRSPEDVRRFAGRHGYPVIVKPRTSAACQGVVVVDKESDLSELADELEHVVEAWIDVPMFHVDGLMADGKVLHSCPARYASPALPQTLQALPSVSAMLDPATDGRVELLRDQAARVVRALPGTPDVTPFHAEFFLGDGGVPILCEIACRPGNPTLAEVAERAYGYNTYRAAIINQASGVPFVPPTGPPAGLFGWAFFLPRTGVLGALPPTRPAELVWFDDRTELGKAYQAPTAPLDHIAKGIYRVDPARVEESLYSIVSWWEDGVVWQ